MMRSLFRFFPFCLLVLALQMTSAQETQRLVFTSDRDGNREIYTMLFDGSQVERLTFNAVEDREPTWSPDQSQIAFASNRDGRWGIYVMDASGSNEQRITPDDGNYYDAPAWSPDGRQIAFVSDRAGGLNIFITTSQGGEPRLITESDRITENIEPSWSPDGRQIVFSSNKDQYFNIYVVDVSNGAAQRVTQEAVDHYSPAWTPTSNQIAYAVNGNSYSEIYLINANGTIPQLLVTADGYYADALTWSPDGQTIAYAVWSNAEKRSIRAVTIDGSSVKQLTPSTSEAGWVQWNTPTAAVTTQLPDTPIGDTTLFCSNSLPSRMSPNLSIRVAYDSRGRPLRLRNQPNTDSDILAELTQGTEMTVVSGPECSNVFTWWYVETDTGLQGWVAEGDPSQNPQIYFIEPTTLAPNTVLIITDSSCPGAPPTPFQIGDVVQVDFNQMDALTLTVSPRGDRGEEDNVGQVHDNERLEIINGPICGMNGDRWRWRIRDLASGMEGWVSEGIQGDSWICPTTNPECGS